MEKLYMLLGERRELTVSITAEGAFTLTEATYTLCERYSGAVEMQGTPTVEGHELRVMLEPKNRLAYTLTLTFCVASERIKKQVFVDVT